MCKKLFFMACITSALGISRSASLGIRIGIGKEKMVSEHLYFPTLQAGQAKADSAEPASQKIPLPTLDSHLKGAAVLSECLYIVVHHNTKILIFRRSFQNENTFIGVGTTLYQLLYFS